MDNQEKSSRSIENRESLKELKEIAEQQQERIDNAKEKEATTPERQAEKLKEARREALETAAKAEKRERNLLEKDKKTSPERHKGPISKKERDKAFDATMREVQSQMSAPSRAFSKVIHNKVIEKTSEVVGNSIARPNAILSGAVCSFILVLAVYLIARTYGYQLSGTETIATFAFGWAIGLIYDYIRLLILGKDK